MLQLCAGLENSIEGRLRSVFAKAEEQGRLRFVDGEIDKAALRGKGEVWVATEGVPTPHPKHPV